MYETAEKWSELALEFKVNEFKQASEAISCGIQALVPQRSIALFTWDQLSVLFVVSLKWDNLLRVIDRLILRI